MWQHDRLAEKRASILQQSFSWHSDTSLSVREIWGSIPGPVKSDTVANDFPPLHVFLKLCCQRAEPLGLTPPLATCFSAILRV